MLVNTGELATHTLGTGKGKSFHKMRQNLGKPLENPFIGHVFSEDTGKCVCVCVVIFTHGVLQSLVHCPHWDLDSPPSCPSRECLVVSCHL